jgi:DNA-binding transcriptional ArsR family regulator
VPNHSEDQIRVTGENLKGLAHPLRVRLLGLLRTYGPATATSLAAELGLTSGALSYHLRQLAKYGFIVEDADRGNRRERWWRAAHARTLFEMEDGAEATIYEDAVVAAVTLGIARARAVRDDLPPQWRRIYNFSDVLLRITAEEAAALGRDLTALLQSYRQHVPGENAPAGSRLVSAQFQIFPVPPAENLPSGS